MAKQREAVPEKGNLFLLTDLDIVIKVNGAIDGNPPEDIFDLSIEPKGGETIKLEISIDQARALSQALSNYITAFEKWDAISLPITVKTKFLDEDEGDEELIPA